MTSQIGNVQILSPALFGSCRLIICLMAMSGMFLGIFMSINLSMAIVCINSNRTDYYQMRNDSIYDESDDLYIDKPTQGLLLGGVYYGMTITQIPVGWICDKRGNFKLFMIMGATVLALGSLLSPMIIESAGVSYFFALRVLQGISIGFIFLPVINLIYRWSTPTDRGLLVGAATLGPSIAYSVAYPMFGFICEHAGGWRSIFYFAGSLGLTWSLLAVFLLHDSPYSHPRITVEEMQYLSQTATSHSKKKVKVVVPWKQMIMSVPVWALLLTNVFFFAAYNCIAVNISIFMKDVLGLTATEIGILSSLPFIGVVLFHVLSGPLYDYVCKRSSLSVTAIRKIFTIAGTWIPAALLLGVSQMSPQHKYWIIGLITVAYSLAEIGWVAGYFFSSIDMAPSFIGLLGGIVRTGGLLTGFLTPVIVSFLTPNGEQIEWSYVFFFISALFIASGSVFTAFGSSKLQSWGRVITNQEKSIEKEISY